MSYNDVWRTDGKMRAPKGKDPEGKNPTWWPESVLEHVADALYQPFQNKYYSDKRTITPRKSLQYAHGHSATARYDIERKVIPLLQEIKAGQGGPARDEVLAEIQSDLATTKNLLSSVAERLDDIQELAENFAEGTLNAEQVAEQLMSKFHAATAPEEQED